MLTKYKVMSQETDLIVSNTFNGMKVAKGLDPNKIISRSIYLYDEPDRKFEKYGHLIWPVVARDHRAILGIGQGNHVWEQSGNFKKFLTELQAKNLYVHEEVNTQLLDIFDGALKDSGMKIKKQYNSHAGFSNYWECVSDRFDTGIKDSYRVGDVVQVGMIVRNGEASNIALGIDLFTNCLSCSNGAVARGKDLGTISISHASSYEKMKSRFIEAIPIAIDAVKKLIEHYQKAVYVNMNQKLAEQFYANLHLADKYYPSYFGIDTDEQKRQKEKKIFDPSKIVHFKGKDITLWETFNDFTAKTWKSSTLQFTGKRGSGIELHRELLKNTVKVSV